MIETTYQQCELHNLCRVQSGYAFKSSAWRNEGVPVIRIANVKSGIVDLTETVFVDAVTAKAAGAFKLALGDILVSMTGHIGEVARVRDSRPVLLNQRVGRFVNINLQKVRPDYLFYCLRASETRDAFVRLGYGAAQPNISPSLIGTVQIPLPALSVQDRIAEILTGYDDLIEVNRRRITLLENMARGLFEEWFVRFRFPGHEAATAIETSEGRLPEAWQYQNAEEIISFDPPTRLAKNGSAPFLSMSELDTTSSLTGSFSQRTGNAGAKFRNGDTLFARITPCLENGKTGMVRGLSPEQPVGFGSTEFIVMREHRAGSAFIYCLARLEAFRLFAQQGMSGASGRQRIATSKLRSFTLAAPVGDELFRRFEATSGPMLELVGSLGAANRKLAATRDLLLPRLLSGRLTIRAAERELADAA